MRCKVPASVKAYAALKHDSEAVPSPGTRFSTMANARVGAIGKLRFFTKHWNACQLNVADGRRLYAPYRKTLASGFHKSWWCLTVLGSDVRSQHTSAVAETRIGRRKLAADSTVPGYRR